MSKKDRLTSADFRTIRPERRIHGAFVTLSITPLSTGRTKHASVVSKKIAALAVQRNLIKRRFRSAVTAAGVPSGPYALVFTAKKTAKDATYADIARDIRNLLKNL